MRPPWRRSSRCGRGSSSSAAAARSATCSTTRCSRRAFAPATPSAPAATWPSVWRAVATIPGSHAARSVTAVHRVAAWAVVVCALAGCAAPDTRAPSAPPVPVVEITLLQINDTYVLEPADDGRRGGMARLATQVKRLRAAHPNVVFAHAGDMLSPSPMSTVLRGAQMIAVLNAVGLDGATFGNHEFDFGPRVLRERMSESRFTWLSANVVERGAGRPFGGAARERVLERAGRRIGLFGLTTADAASTSAGGADVDF